MTAAFQPKPSPRHEVTITRVVDAPRELVFTLWTDPIPMAQWWGPHGFTNPVCELDARAGGAIRIHMRGPDGVVYPMTGTFSEVAAPERLVFASVASDHTGMPLLEAIANVTFADESGKTRVTVVASAIGLAPIAPQMIAGMEAGWTQSLERLGALAAAQA